MPFPFTAFPGYVAAQRALLCTLVDPTLRGVIISGAHGTGKSALLRSFCAFAHTYLDPDMPMARVPIGVTDDRLIGGIDIERALETGERHASRGLIAEAHNGFLCIDDLSLLDQGMVSTVMQSLESGVVVCEREGVSASYASRFVLLASVAPGERELAASVADRVAFLITAERRVQDHLVESLIRSLENHARNPAMLLAEHQDSLRRFAERVTAARMIGGMIVLADETIERLSQMARKFGVEGNRAVLFAAKAARAHAALRGSRMIEEQDVTFALTTVLAPRAMRLPENMDDSSPPEQQDDRSPGAPEQRSQSADEGMNEGDGEGETDNQATQQLPTEHDQDDEQTAPRESGSQVFDPLDFEAPLQELQEFFPETGRTATRFGGGSPAEQWKRGRHTRSVMAELRGRRIALGATLRAAATRQKSRRKDGEMRVVVRVEDIRVKRFSERAGTLFIFCVDASGSMAANRMREAKGAVTRLLHDAYVHRDTVSLIVFRGPEAEIVLPPTGSVERAKRSMDVMPTGGGTPLASALLKAYQLVERSRRGGGHQALVVLLTDGRANVPMTGRPADMITSVRRQHVRQELEHLATMYRRAKVPSVVIDTRHAYGENSEAAQLAGLLDGEYYYLPLMDAGGIVALIGGRAGRGG